MCLLVVSFLYTYEQYNHTHTHSSPNKNDVMRLGERPRSLEGKPDHLDLPFAINLYYSMSTISYGKALTVRLSKRLGAAMTARSFRFNIRVSVLS